MELVQWLGHGGAVRLLVTWVQALALTLPSCKVSSAESPHFSEPHLQNGATTDLPHIPFLRVRLAKVQSILIIHGAYTHTVSQTLNYRY